MILENGAYFGKKGTKSVPQKVQFYRQSNGATYFLSAQ